MSVDRNKVIAVVFAVLMILSSIGYVATAL